LVRTSPQAVQSAAVSTHRHAALAACHRHAEGDRRRVSAEAKKALADSALQAKLVEQGMVAVGSSPEEFRAFVGEEIARWAKVISDAGIKVEQ
jgi:tripartite-type tricarboxylate transporter receptor subunit TctC